MDGYLKLLFVEEDTLTGEIIQKFTGGQWSHVAIIDDDILIEAMPPLVTISSIHRYESFKTEIVEIYVPDIEAALAKAKSLVDKPYAVIGCIEGGLHDVFDIQLPGDGEKTINCCELAIRSIRAGGSKLREEISADCWTPQRLYAEIKLVK